MLRIIEDAPYRRTASKVELTLPLPPSVNALYRNRTKFELARAKALGRPARGRKKTERYESWERAAGNAINATRPRPGHVAGDYALTLIIGEAARLDLGNVEKAISDTLQKHLIIENDRKAQSIHLSRSEHVARHECLVIVTPVHLAKARAA